MVRRNVLGRRSRREPEEHKEDLGRWLLTYSDMITLLLLFFIVLYTISSLNVGKFKQISAALSSVFNGGNFGMLFDRSDVGTAELSYPVTRQPAQVSKVQNQSLLYTRTISELNLYVRQHLVRVVSNATGVTITLPADAEFASGSATIEQSYYPVLEHVANLLASIPNKVRLEGNTDNLPVDGRPYTSNFQLASERAVNTLLALRDYGVRKGQMSAVSYGSTRPLVSNATPEGRAYNRRVDIVILTPQE